MALALALAGASLAGCSSTFEPFSAEASDAPQEENLTKGIMTAIGAIDPQDKPIEYRPRAALVVPPKADLPVPQNTDAALASQKFPVNPEDRSVRSPNGGSSDGVLSLAEQQRLATVPRIQPTLPSQSAEEQARPMTPEQLNKPAAMVAANTTATRSSKRTLVDPPQAYATPSPNAPFEEAKEKEASWKPGWWPF